MADPKTVAGGVAVVAIGGGSGYAISSAVASKNESQEQGQKNEGKPESAPKTLSAVIEGLTAGTIGKKIQEQEFVLLNEKEADNSKWTKVVEVLKKSSETKTAEELKNYCLENLIKSATETSPTFEEVAKKCTSPDKTFAERAKKIGITLLSEDTGYSTRWTAIQNEFNTMKTDSSISEVNSLTSTEKEAIKGYCEKVKDLTYEKIAEGKDLTKEWNNYLKACSSNKDVTKNFWTGE